MATIQESYKDFREFQEYAKDLIDIINRETGTPIEAVTVYLCEKFGESLVQAERQRCVDLVRRKAFKRGKYTTRLLNELANGIECKEQWHTAKTQ